MGKNILFIVLASLFLMTGCASQRYYKNTNYTGNIQALLNRDLAYCSAIAAGRVPPKTPRIEGDSYSYSHGNMMLRDSYGNTIDGTYNQSTKYYNPMSTANNAMNLASMIGAGRQRAQVEEMCMAQLGWYQISKQAYLDSNRPTPQQPALQNTQTQVSVEEAEAMRATFRERMKVEHPDYANLSEAERTVLFEKIKIWISKKTYSEAAPLMEAFERGNMEQVLALFTLYKQENAK